MPDDSYVGLFGPDPLTAGRPQSDEVSWGDYGNQLGADIATTAKDMVTAPLRYVSEAAGADNLSEAFKQFGDALSAVGDNFNLDTSPQALERKHASFASEKFWEHPGSALMLKSMGMVPAVAATVIPAVLTGGGALAKTLISAAANGVLGAGASIEDVYNITDKKSDAELQKNDLYMGLRASGLDEKSAREQFNRQVLGAKPLLNFLAMAGAGAVGVPGMLARGTGAIGAKGRALMGRLGVGAAEGGLGMGAAAGVGDATSQFSHIELGEQGEFNNEQLANAMLEGTVMGGLGGAAAHGLLGERPVEDLNVPPPPPPSRPSNIEVVPAAGPDAAQSAAMGGADPNAPVTPPGNATPSTVPVPDPTQSGAPPAPPAARADAVKRLLDAITAAPGARMDALRATTGLDFETFADAVEVLELQGAIARRPSTPANPISWDLVQPTTPTAVKPVADQGKTVPEAPQTLQEQKGQLVNDEGDRSAVLYPKGTPKEKIPPVPKGMASKKTKDGVVHYDPTKITPKEIYDAAANGTLNEVLGLGPVTKTEAVARELAGEKPVAVTERTPTGVEVKAAAGTEQTAPAQVEALEASKTPGNTIAVETPEQVMAGRNAGQEAAQPAAPEVRKPTPAATKEEFLARNGVTKVEAGRSGLPEKKAPRQEGKGDLAQTVTRPREEPTLPEAVTEGKPGEPVNKDLGVEPKLDAVDANRELAAGVAEPPATEAAPKSAPKGKKRSKADIASRANIRKLFDETPSPPEMSARHPDTLMSYLVALEHRMRELKIKLQDRASDKGTPEEIVWLREAMEMLSDLRNGRRSPTRIKDYVAKDWLTRNGEAEGVKVSRRVEGDIKSKKGDGEARNTGDKAKEEVRDDSEEMSGEMEAGIHEAPEEDAAGPRERKSVAAQEREEVLGRSDMHVEEPDAKSAKDEPLVAEEEGYKPGKGEETADERLARERDTERASREAGKEKKDYSGSVTAGKNAAGSGIRVEISGPGRKRKIRHMRGMDEENAHVYEPVAEGDRKLVGTIASLFNKSWLLKKLSPNMRGFTLRARNHRAVLNQVETWLKNVVGDVPVYRISEEAMVKAMGTEKDGRTAAGFYDANEHAIYLHEKFADHAEIQIHEAVHAALVRELHENAPLHDYVERLRQEVEDALGATKADYYGLTNVHEFLAEALSNPEFQYALSIIDAPAWAIQKVIVRGLDGHANHGQIRSIWDTLVAGVQKLSRMFRRGTFGSKEVADMRSVLDALMKVPEAIDAMYSGGEVDYVWRPEQKDPTRPLRGKARARAYETSAYEHEDVSSPSAVRKSVHAKVIDPAERIKDFGKSMADGLESNSNARRNSWKVVTLEQFRQGYEKLFNPDTFRKITNLMMGVDVRTHEISRPGTDLARDMARLRSEHESAWPQLQQLFQEGRLFSAHPDLPLTDPKNAHLKNASHMQGAAKHADMKATFDALPEPLKKLYKDTIKYYEDAHEAHAIASITSHINDAEWEAGYNPKGLEKRIYEGKLTAGDRFALKNAYSKEKVDALLNARELRTTEGPYVPLTRRGDFVVVAEHKIDAPAGARRLNGKNVEDPTGDRYEFTDKAEAEKFAKGLEAHAVVEEVTMNDDGKHVTDPKEIEKLRKAGNLDERWRVEVNRKHIEFHESETDARNSYEELTRSGNYENVERERRRSANPGLDMELSSPQVRTLIKSLEQNKRLSAAEKKSAISTLIETSIGMQRGNRALKHSIRARKFSGASDDAFTNLIEYNSSNSRARARMETEQETSDTLAEMRKWDRDRQDKKSIVRSDVVRELEDRLYSTYAADPKGAYSRVMSKVMTYSFLTRLMSPAYLMVNMTQPWMVTAPVLSARHGYAKAMTQLTRAYRDMGAGRAIAEGGRGFKRVWKDQTADPTNFAEHFKKNLAGVSDAAALGKMIDELSATGHIHPEAGMEVHRMDPGRGALNRGLDRVDGAFRQIVASTEAINRVATAISAYRMELQKTGSHKKAVEYAADMVGNTQGMYSRANNAPIFRNPILKPFLQFKQFPQMMYHLIAKNLYDTFKGETPEVRWQAAKTFAGIVATHTAMAGALGLPTEPIKALLILSNALGVTDMKVSEVEDALTQKLAQKFGPKAAEIMLHGLTRALGPASIDVTNRMGLSNLLFFGEPEPGNRNDTTRWLADFALGAPGSLAADWMEGTRHLANGDFLKGAEKMMPSKAIVDIAKAADMFINGKPTKRGAPGAEPLSAVEAIVQGIGFKPAKLANFDAARGAAFEQQKRLGKDRQELLDDWLNADPADKADAFKQIQSYNRTKPAEQRITPQMLTRAAKGRTSLERENILGMEVRPKTKPALKQIERDFNVK